MPRRCARCDWTGEGDEAVSHAIESQHPICVVCARRSLTEFEPQACPGCVVQIRSDILDVLDGYAGLPPVIAGTALHPGTLPGGDALVLHADGSTQGGGSDEWMSDPVPVLAVLESNERDWRRTYNDPPAVDLATVSGCADYLLRNLEGGHNAAQTHPAIDEFASELNSLRWRVQHVAGLANDPEVAKIPCACRGRLVREYGATGLADDWTCTSCDATYNESAYMLRLRVLSDQPGWVSIDAAARAVTRPVATIRAWMRSQHVPSACNRVTRRTMVELDAVLARSAEVGRVVRKSA